MNALEVVRRFFDAWNSHNVDAILALYAEGGTYSAPRAGEALTGQAIAEFAKKAFTAFPDFHIPQSAIPNQLFPGPPIQK